MSKIKENRVSTYLYSALEEYGKITWPTKEQAALLTAVTIVVSIFFIVLIGASDLGFSELYRGLLDLTS